MRALSFLVLLILVSSHRAPAGEVDVVDVKLIKDGRLIMPLQPGRGLTISDRMSGWVQAKAAIAD